MANVPIGSQKTDSAQTPTLRQFAKKYPDRRPKICTVSVIFLPNKAPNYTFVVDTGFRVSILEDNPLHGVISDSVERWMADCTCLVIQPTDWEKGHFELCENTDELCDWDEKTWGYKLTVKEKQKTRAKK